MSFDTYEDVLDAVIEEIISKGLRREDVIPGAKLREQLHLDDSELIEIAESLSGLILDEDDDEFDYEKMSEMETVSDLANEFADLHGANQT